MELFTDDKDVLAALNKNKLSTWAALYNIAQAGTAKTIGSNNLSPTYYSAAHFYKVLKHQDWGHDAPPAQARIPISTNLQVGLNSNDAATAINQLAVSVSRRNIKPSRLQSLDKLGHELLGLAQSQSAAA